MSPASVSKNTKNLAGSISVQNYNPLTLWPAVMSAMFDLPYFFATKIENGGRQETVVSCLFIFDIQSQIFGSLYSL